MLVAEFEVRRDPVEVGLEKLAAELPRRVLGAPRHAGAFIGAEHHAGTLLAHVDLGLEVDDVGQLVAALLVVGNHLRHLVGDEIHVLHGQHGKLDPHHAANLARPEAAAVHHMLGVDVALVGDHVPGAVGAVLQLLDLGVLVDLGTADAGRLGIGMRGAFGVEVAVGRVDHGADEILLLQKRMHLLGFRHGDDLGLKTEIARAGMRHLQPFHAFMGVGEDQAARAVQPAGLARDLLELVIKRDCVALQLGHVRIAVQRVEAARRMPGGSRGEDVALDQHHVLPARLGEMIEHRTADDTAADHHHTSLGLHGNILAKWEFRGVF